MWLLNIFSHELECFDDKDVPPYAALSHRWETDEVTFQDILAGQGRSKKGYRKIDLCCKQAAQPQKWYNRFTHIQTDKLSYVWIDTCCLDKTNSAGLSEAINSMYRWYREAAVCYVYLADVKSKSTTDEFESSQWFRRGWTLQELLAPSDVQFFNSDWALLGDRRSLTYSISNITGIPKGLLNNFEPWSQGCVADVMSWAASRKTSRNEDRAYSLLGLFDIHMPIIYGEGKRAFYRLQEEILKVSHDMTIFAWTRAAPRHSMTSGIFADSPTWFGFHSGTLTKWEPPSELELGIETLSGSIMTGKGLSVSLALMPIYMNTFMAPLCSFSDSLGERTMGMLLQRMEDGLYRRYRGSQFDGLFDIPPADGWNVQTRSIILARDALHKMPPTYLDSTSIYGFNIDTKSMMGSCEFYSRSETSKNVQLGILMGSSGTAGMICNQIRGQRPIFYIFGYDFDFSPFCLLIRADKIEQQSWKPQTCFVVVPRIGPRAFTVGSNRDMLDLVSALSARNNEAWSIDKDGVELHLMSWSTNRSTISASTGGELTFLASDAITFGKLSARSQSPKQSITKDVDKWYHQTL